MATAQSFGRNLRIRAAKSAALIIEFLSDPKGYLELELILVSPEGRVFAIISYQGRDDHKEVEFARAIVEELTKSKIIVLTVSETIRENTTLKKTAGFNRRNVSGWSQRNTILLPVSGEDINLDQVRDKHIEWKTLNS